MIAIEADWPDTHQANCYVKRLTLFKDAQSNPEQKVGFYGLDLYMLPSAS